VEKRMLFEMLIIRFEERSTLIKSSTKCSAESIPVHIVEGLLITRNQGDGYVGYRKERWFAN